MNDLECVGGDVEAAAIAGAGSGVSVLSVGSSRWWCWGSGRERDLPQAGECFGEGQSPGPVLGQAQKHFALAVVLRLTEVPTGRSTLVVVLDSTGRRGAWLTAASRYPAVRARMPANVTHQLHRPGLVPIPVEVVHGQSHPGQGSAPGTGAASPRSSTFTCSCAARW